MSVEKLAPWTRRDNLSVKRHQEVVDRVNAESGFTSADPGAEVRGGAFGRSVTNPAPIHAGMVIKVSAKSNSPTTGGTYSGRSLINDTIQNTSATTLTEPLGQTDLGYDDVWIVNPAEDGSSSWAMTVPFTAIGLVTGYADDGRITVEIATGGGGSGLPPGTGIYKVLQLIDNLNPGTPDYDYVRFH